ncbi:Pectate lyase L precursor [Posidoniimonas polymericola]|uniref:Probable pectate lyase C n=1 Tax=Posidoniimonas polymericola TaxID=2528002 RepID=A0A5C5YEM5_9BACT|nr:right-handed parallel beta-helix repeat-containing protein [Posidoniimonas polymericola]TWT73790.1 Pectate lyase L precursor [Posidoniimonas polymericola]
MAPRLSGLLLIVAVSLTAGWTGGAEFYVSPSGIDANPGTLSSPFGSLARAQQAVSPGDTVWIRGGDYNFVAGQGASEYGVLFNKSGNARNPIKYWAYPGETPAFDFSEYLPTERIRGFSVQADYLHFKGIELRGVQQTITNVNESWGIRVEGAGGDFNIFEQLNLHHNEGPGLFIANGGHNLVLNSDSHHNYDPDRGGENADGFGSHSNDDGNTFIGARAWENSDDGYDFINSDGRVELIGSWAWRNGFIPDTNTAAGNGAGIKAGGFLLDSSRFPDPEDVPTNLVQGNLSFDNRVQGFYANHHPGGIDWVNNTAFDNPRGFDLLNDVDPANWPADHYLRNNIAYANNSDLANANHSLIDDEANSWNLPNGLSSQDFLSLAPTGVDGPRQADGGLPVLDFLRLASGSGLVDAGQDVGLDFNGLAPDLGAFESGYAGDFNADGLVDAADYVVWRDNLGTVFSLGDLQAWVANYGWSDATSAPQTVPEPGVAMLLALVALLTSRRKPAR